MKIALSSLACGLLGLFSLTIHAQTFKWAYAVQDTTVLWGSSGAVTTDHHSHVIATGNFFVKVQFGAYTLATSQPANDDGYIAKYDSSGKVLWAIDVRASGAGDPAVLPHSVATDKDDNIYIGGYYSNTIDFTATDSIIVNSNALYGQESFIAKYDSNGKFLWAADNNTPGECNALTTDANNNVIWAGYYVDSADFSGIKLPPSSGLFNLYVAKYTAAGVPVWAQPGLLPHGYSLLQGMAADPSGNIYIAGATYGNIIFGSDSILAPSDSKAMVIKFDSSGTVKWYHTESNPAISNSGYNSAYGVAADKEGNVYISGTLGDKNAFGSDLSESFIAKYGANGTKKFLSKFAGANSSNEGGVSLDAKGRPYVTGNYANEITIGGINLYSIGGTSTYVVGFDTTGNVMWALTSQGGAGTGIGTDQNSGNIIITGTLELAATFGTDTIAPLYSFPNGGNQYFAYISNPSKASTGIPTEKKNTAVLIYPNPTDNLLYVANAALNTTIKIYNISGQPVYFGMTTKNVQAIDVSKLPAGMYMAQLADQEGVHRTITFVKK